MRPAFFILFAFTFFFGTSYWYLQTASVCPAPVTYRLGELDKRFPITETEAREVIAKAEAVWEEALGRDLFAYDEKSSFAINFIYDERQQMASTEEEWRVSLDAKEAASRAVIEQVKEQAEKYEEAQKSYDLKRTEYEGRLDLYNERVKALNEQGGAPAPIFAELQEEQSKLSDLLRRLLEIERELATQVEAINKLGDKGNKLVEQYNNEVQQYNEIYGNIEQYTQGDFKRERINIYKFSDKTELTKVIAHEFGHALGVGHVEGEQSMMYYLMAEQPDSITLSVTDKEALITICGDGTGFAYQLRRIIRNGLSYF